MTKCAALHQFWSGFGIDAYEENSVPSGADAPSFPYITYSVVTDSIGNEVPLSANLWYRSSSWVQCNAKSDEIAESIGSGGRILSFDGGAMWIKRGAPFAQNMGDDNDDMIKRKYINIVVEFISND